MSDRQTSFAGAATKNLSFGFQQFQQGSLIYSTSEAFLETEAAWLDPSYCLTRYVLSKWFWSQLLIQAELKCKCKLASVACLFCFGVFLMANSLYCFLVVWHGTHFLLENRLKCKKQHNSVHDCYPKFSLVISFPMAYSFKKPHSNVTWLTWGIFGLLSNCFQDNQITIWFLINTHAFNWKEKQLWEWGYLKSLGLISICLSLYSSCLITETLPKKPALEVQTTSEKDNFLM